MKVFEIFEKIGFGKKIKLKRIFLISLIITLFFVTVGVTPLLWTWNEHLKYNLSPNEMIEPYNENIINFSEKFDEYLSNSNAYDNTPRAEFDLLKKYIYKEFEYISDFSNNLAIHHLDSINDIFERGSDDCDGFAIITCSILRYRGYNAYVLMNMIHAWVNVYDNNDLFNYNFFNALNSPFVKFNDLGSEFFINEICFQFSIYILIASSSLIIINIMAFTGLDLTRKIKKRYSQWLFDISVQRPSLPSKKTIYENIKTTLIDIYYYIKDFFTFVYQNFLAISFILVYFVVTLYTTLFLIGIIGVYSGVWNYEESYLQRGIRLEEQGIFIISGFLLANFWLVIYLTGINTIWSRLGKNNTI